MERNGGKWEVGSGMGSWEWEVGSAFLRGHRANALFHWCIPLWGNFV